MELSQYDHKVLLEEAGYTPRVTTGRAREQAVKHLINKGYLDEYAEATQKGLDYLWVNADRFAARNALATYNSALWTTRVLFFFAGVGAGTALTYFFYACGITDLSCGP